MSLSDRTTDDRDAPDGDPPKLARSRDGALVCPGCGFRGFEVTTVTTQRGTYTDGADPLNDDLTFVRRGGSKTVTDETVECARCGTEVDPDV